MTLRSGNHNYCVWFSCNSDASYGLCNVEIAFTNHEELGVLPQMGEAISILFCYKGINAECSSGLCRRVIH